MSTTVTPQAAQGSIPVLNIPDTQDYPRLVFTAPYHQTVPLAELIEPSVIESVESLLPSLVPPYVQSAANDAVAQQAVMLTGSSMSGPLYLNPVMPTQPNQAASMSYVDTMIATAGVPEVPTVPQGQTWARQTGQWVPLDPSGGNFLPITGGSMQGPIQMNGNAINNLPAVPNMPNGAASATWVLNQIAANSLYQGTYVPETNTPDLTQPGTHQNAFTWIVVTSNTSGVVISQPIPGLQGLTVYNGDNLIYSAMVGQFQIVRSGGLSLGEAEALFLPLAGGQMSGNLMLNANATSAMQAVTLQQLQAAADFPEAPADGQVYGRQGLSKSWMPSLPLGGGVLTGALTLSGNATQNLNAVPLQQVNNILTGYVPLAGNATVIGPLTMSGAGANLTLNSNAAANLQAVPLQQLTSTLANYATISQVNGLAPLASPVFTGDPQAPTAAATDNDTSIATTAFVQRAAAPSAGNVGRNVLHNAMFNVQQRGAGPWATNGSYTADRWELSLTGDTANAGVNLVSDAVRAQIGDEAAQSLLGNTFTGVNAAANFNRILQKIENVRRLAGRNVILSFWAWCGSGTLNLGAGLVQNFGTGGSPSASVVINGQAASITATPTRYSMTFAIPNAQGKTLGTNSDSNTELSFWFSSGTTQSVAAGNPGVQSGTVGIWGVQLEVAQPGQTQPTALEKLDPQQDLANCQRFYQVVNVTQRFYGPVSSAVMDATVTYVVQMRATPTIVVTNAGTPVNVVSQAFFPNTSASGFLQLQNNAVGDCSVVGASYGLSADL